MRHFFPALGLLATLAGCTTCGPDETPAPTCYSAKVVGAACMDGLLLEVDRRYAIGAPSGNYTNLVAAVNLESTDSLRVAGQVVRAGQTIYFTYQTSPTARQAFCPQNTVPLAVPHVVLSNVSLVSCLASKLPVGN
ncbi:hypothetical protein [Hymenobacter persicinus]|uniref:Lipoprotein n=1 Tax=Hymenobacter persicinus TaxID=2025506 RepID=A0A4Q5LEI4_9BACT|nr:hypothetical protein [Hymenobacter persicinus]RYU80720.1 hypothetical protein EWM57_07655 [Hymenobacter persicinus]